MTIDSISDACCSLDIGADEQVKLIGMFKAMGNPTRFEIIRYLLTHPNCITGDIVEFLPISQSTTSQHLKVLREAGLICGTTSGPATSYCLDSDNIAWFRAKVGDIF